MTSLSLLAGRTVEHLSFDYSLPLMYKYLFSVFNVAVKGRVVELLANEIARTEIIRALLYEYAKECVQNITVLEKGCFSCMMERCENR